MKTVFKKQFAKQLETIKDQKLKASILTIILKVEACHSIAEITNLKKLKGFKNFIVSELAITAPENRK